MTRLKDGKYYIVNHTSGARVGVSPLDPGFTRWSVGKQAEHLEEHELRAVTWSIVHKEGDLYELVVEKGFARPFEFEDAVHAPPGQEEYLWRILYREGNNAYTIEEVGIPQPRGWVLRDEETQVKLAPLPSTKSIPPQFRGTDIWDFKYI